MVAAAQYNPQQAAQGTAVDEHKLIASICKDSFFDFVQEFWSEVIAEEPVWNWHIAYLCNELQQLAERVFLNQPKQHDCIINVPPGTTKSTIVSVMFPAWCLARKPSTRLLCVSHTHDLSLDLSTKSRLVVESEKYRRCFPAVRLRADQNTKGHWATTAGGQRYCATVGGKSPMGQHAHFIIVDDPIDPQQALSEAALQAANNYMENTLPSRKVNKRVTVTVLIMQRLHQDDPTGRLLEKRDNAGRKVHHICLPASSDYPIWPAELKWHYDQHDGLLDPLRLDREVLAEAMTEGAYNYAGQFGQQPIPRAGGMFKAERFRIERHPPLPKDLVTICRYWDKAGSEAGGDWTVGVKVARDRKGHFWVLDVLRGQWAAEEREATIVLTARADGRRCLQVVEQEPGSGGKDSAEATVKRLAGLRVTIDKVTGSKEHRADPFCYQVNVGNVTLVEAPWNLAFIEEHRHFPRGKNDDQVDAASGAFIHAAKGRRILGSLAAYAKGQALQEEIIQRPSWMMQDKPLPPAPPKRKLGSLDVYAGARRR